MNIKYKYFYDNSCKWHYIFKFFLTMQISFHNIGPLLKQHAPGVDLQPVNIDVYFDGAPLNCYTSSGPLFNDGVSLSAGFK